MSFLLRFLRLVIKDSWIQLFLELFIVNFVFYYIPTYFHYLCWYKYLINLEIKSREERSREFFDSSIGPDSALMQESDPFTEHYDKVTRFCRNSVSKWSNFIYTFLLGDLLFNVIIFIYEWKSHFLFIYFFYFVLSICICVLKIVVHLNVYLTHYVVNDTLSMNRVWKWR